MLADILSLQLDTLYDILQWIIRIGALALVPFRRTPDATRSWLLLIFFLPVPGLLLFLAIGRPRFPRWRRERFTRMAPMFDALADRLDTPQADDPAIGALARTLGLLPPTGGNRVELIEDYDGAIDRLIADIDGARRHVRILVYIFADDRIGQRVTAALGRARERGIPVHVLFDPVGSAHWAGTARLLRSAGVEARAALPLRILRRRTRRDMRNHRKLFLIDGEIGFAGSQNIVARDFRPGIVNRELVARVEGPAVAEMEALFVADWYLETEQLLEKAPVVPGVAGDACIQLLPSGANYPLEGFETLLVWQIHQARERATIVTPYFIPNEALIGAMRTAVARGVAVDLVVSRIADQPLVNLAQCSYYDELLASGVRIFRFVGGLLHAKNVSIDGRLAIIGSSNVDIRSFQLNDEVSLLLTDPGSVAALEAIQRGYLLESAVLDPAEWRMRGRPRQFAENVARMVSPLL